MGLFRVLGALALVFGLMAGAARAAPLEAYGKLPSIEQMEISPSGKSLAMIVTDGEERIVAIQDLVAKKLVLRAPVGAAKLKYLMWAGEDHLILVTSTTGTPEDVMTRQREWRIPFEINLQERKLKPLLANVENAMNTIYGVPVVREVEGRPRVFVQGVRFVGGNGRLSLFQVDLKNSRASVVETGFPDTRDWVVDPKGGALAQELYNIRTGRWAVRLKSGGSWREMVSAVAPLDPPVLMDLGRDSTSVIYATSDAEGRQVWHELRADGGAPAEPAPSSQTGDPLRDPTTGRLIGVYNMKGDEGRYDFFDPTDARLWKAVTKAYPGSAVSLMSSSADRRKIVILVDSPEEGPAYALVDLNTLHATWLGDQYDGLKPDDISPQGPIRFKAGDGLELTGYLTLPRGRAAKGLPLVVFPHGGPAARDIPGFDWWAQAMASRGYAVVQVNFRGSDGLGRSLLEAGYGQWGRRMQTDLSDAVRHLAKQGIIDPKRVCIVGASYGGYAALAGAAIDTGVYRCAASVAGISEMRRFVGWEKTNNGVDSFRYWNRFAGAENANDPVLSEISPAAHVDRVSIPVLLVHGKDDSVVPLEQSRIMADALTKAGKPVELVVLKGEDHWLSRGETRNQMLQAVVAFLEKNNPPN